MKKDSKTLRKEFTEMKKNIRLQATDGIREILEKHGGTIDLSNDLLGEYCKTHAGMYITCDYEAGVCELIKGARIENGIIYIKCGFAEEVGTARIYDIDELLDVFDLFTWYDDNKNS